MIKLYVNNHGWVMVIERENDNITGLRYTKHKAGAKPFKGDWFECKEAFEVMDYIEEKLKCNYDKVWCNPWEVI